MKTVNKIDMKHAGKDLTRKANSLARKAGYGRADEIVIGDEDRVIHHTRYGYVKNTTGEYVPNRYRRNFGWKNTHYCSAHTVVMLTPETAGF